MSQHLAVGTVRSGVTLAGPSPRVGELEYCRMHIQGSGGTSNWERARGQTNPAVMSQFYVSQSNLVQSRQFANRLRQFDIRVSCRMWCS